MDDMNKDFEKELEKEIEKRVTEGATKWVPIIIQIVISFVISVIVFKFVWAWVVPDLFPGAVDQGLISANLTWLASLKLAILVGVFSGFYDTILGSVKDES
jgi:hypothetical protein